MGSRQGGAQQPQQMRQMQQPRNMFPQRGQMQQTQGEFRRAPDNGLQQRIQAARNARVRGAAQPFTSTATGPVTTVQGYEIGQPGMQGPVVLNDLGAGQFGYGNGNVLTGDYRKYFT